MTGVLTFSTPEARRLWQDFQRRLDRANRELDAAARADISAEAASHIRDAMEALDEGDELTRLQAAISSYGDLPAAPPAWRQPAAVVLHYGSILALGIAGIFVLIFLHMTVMEVFNPQGVGLWHYGQGDWSLSYEAQVGATEVLGGWFIPAMLTLSAVIAALLYALWRFAVAPGGPVSTWMKD
ncbi:hypothetical protein [Maricaulis sp.]|uniref:hypothetical protein n=1 Tax=Maricaulis sp. TaxID=1486257 RepID=UPI003A917F74